jgi:hypothetical protein
LAQSVDEAGQGNEHREKHQGECDPMNNDLRPRGTYAWIDKLREEGQKEQRDLWVCRVANETPAHKAKDWNTR